MDVNFEEDDYNKEFKSYNADPERRGSSMVNFLIKHGVVKNEKSASIFLLIISIIFILISTVLFTRGRIIGISIEESVNKDSYVIIEGFSEPVLVPAGERVSDVVEKYKKIIKK